MIYYSHPDERRLVDATGVYFTPANTDFPELAERSPGPPPTSGRWGPASFTPGTRLGSGAPGTYINATTKYTTREGFLSLFPSGFAVSGELGYYALGTTSPQLGSVALVDYTYWNVGASYTYKNATLDLRYHDTDLDKGECFVDTTDPRGIAAELLRSNWCGATFIATLSLDFHGKPTRHFCADTLIGARTTAFVGGGMIVEEIEKLGAALADCRREGKLGELPLIRISSIEEAEAVQAAALDAYGGVPSGYSMQATSALTRRLLQCAEPIFGVLVDFDLLYNGAKICLPYGTLGAGLRFLVHLRSALSRRRRKDLARDRHQRTLDVPSNDRTSRGAACPARHR